MPTVVQENPPGRDVDDGSFVVGQATLALGRGEPVVALEANRAPIILPVLGLEAKVDRMSRPSRLGADEDWSWPACRRSDTRLRRP